MSIHQFAKFFVRFNGLAFLFWAVYELTYFVGYYENYALVHEFPIADSVAAREFITYIGRVALQLLAAAILFGKTEEIISLLTVGKWTKESNQSVQTRPTSGPV